MRLVISAMSFAAAALIVASGPVAAQNASQGATHYEQHNLGPTGCDIVITGVGKNNSQRPVHFDEGQRQTVGGQLMICRGGQLLDANAPPPRPATAPPSP